MTDLNAPLDLENIFPVIKRGQKPITEGATTDGVTHTIPVEAQIAIYPIFDGPGVFAGADTGPVYSYLNNSQIDPKIGMEGLIEKAYSNCLKKVEKNLVIKINGGFGMITNADDLETSLVL